MVYLEIPWLMKLRPGGICLAPLAFRPLWPSPSLTKNSRLLLYMP